MFAEVSIFFEKNKSYTREINKTKERQKMVSLDELVALPESELQKKFDEAVNTVKTGPAKEGVTNDQKLKVYALFKQVNFGDNTDAQPWAVQLEKRAKWDAWNAEKGKSKSQAMAEYVIEIGKQMS
eukprot:maker-scaffold_45-snap-gene-1.107-mRNA-1 protein AED:0.04 eAED:0.19 QI:40/0/0.5/1/0/0/2/0/125